MLGEILLEENQIYILHIYKYWNKIINYIEEKYTDKEYKLNFYIMSLYNIGYILYKDNKYSESSFYVNKGIDCIIKNKFIYCLNKFLLLIINLRYFVDYEVFDISKSVDYEDIEIILQTLKQWNTKNFDEKNLYKTI